MTILGPVAVKSPGGGVGIPEASSEKGNRQARAAADAGKPTVKRRERKLGWARWRARKAGVKDVEALTPEELAKYMVPGPHAGGGNGED